MNNLSLERYYVIVFKYYAFEQLSCDIFADISSFRKNTSCGIIQPHSTPFDVLVYLLTTNGLPVRRSLKNLKNEGPTMLRESPIQKLEEMFFSKNLNNY